MANLSYNFIVSTFEFYFMGDEHTKPQACTIECGADLDKYRDFFANQVGYDLAIKEASAKFGKHVDSYWPGSLGGFQVENGNNTLMVLRYWAKWLKSQGFTTGSLVLVKLDEHGNLPPISDEERKRIDRYEDAVAVLREIQYEGAL